MKNFIFNIPTKIVFGTGKINELETFLTPDTERLLIVTDKNIAHKSDALNKLLFLLKNKDVSVFDEVEENPSLGLVEKGGNLAMEINAQTIIGLGGGSPMDAAKGCAVLAKNPAPMSDYMKGKSLANDPLPVICIPTSSGTGSEVTPYAVFTDPANQSKGGFSHPSIFPRTSIIDPELTYSMPESVIVNTGLDALTHSLEAYLSTDAYELNDVLALHSIETVLDNLGAAAKKNKEAMARMAYTAMLAGIAITNAGTILLHIMAYPLTVFHNIPHGKANAALLPAFLGFMKEKSTVKEKIGKLEKMFAKVGGIKEYINGFNISTSLPDYGVDKSELELFAKKTIIKSDIKITPAEITEKDIVDIYLAAWN
jgi:alcohol dehydrogenase class IV